jgi:hypothetical protein
VLKTRVDAVAQAVGKELWRVDNDLLVHFHVPVLVLV